jgi:cytochrome c oxidase subunit 1
MWGGKLEFTTAMLFAIGLVGMFTIGGLSGVTHAVAPADTQQTDTYYIVAHFHYVLFGGAMMGLFSGFYFWWPKVFGHFLNEKAGKVHFWLMLIGFNLTFGPMHILGLQGMSRRIYTYEEGLGFDAWNLVSSIGAFTIAVSILVFLGNVISSRRDAPNQPAPGPDPWDARSLEWMVASPTPEHNFDEIPTVTQLDEFWHRKYGKDDDGRTVRIAATEDVTQDGSATGVHLPAPSYWPLVVSVGLPLVGYGLIFNLAWAVPGALLVLGGIYGWALEPADDDENPPHHDHGHDEGHEPTEALAPGEAPAAELEAGGAEPDGAATDAEETSE